MVMIKEWFTSVTSKILKLSFADSCHHALHCKETWPLRKGKLLETHIWIIRAQGSDWFFTIIQTDEERARVDMLAEQSMDFRWDCCFLLVISEDWQKSQQCWSEIRISGTDGFDFATPPLQAPTMSLQRKPTWKSNWNQDKHMIIESQGNGKEILNHYLILLRQGCLRHFSSLKLSWEAGDHHSVLVVNVPFLFRSQDCSDFSLLLFS